jgi:F0F1-type ATP synthase beta subunit
MMAGKSDDVLNEILEEASKEDYCELSPRQKRTVNNAAREICQAVNDRTPNDAPTGEMTGREIIHALGIWLNQQADVKHKAKIRRVVREHNTNGHKQEQAELLEALA